MSTIDSRFGSSPENPTSINEIFRERHEEFLPRAAEQLSQPLSAEVDILGERLHVDYRVLDMGGEVEVAEKKDPVVVLQGFGSGWEGIAELGFSIAADGRKAILLSLPGTGNSENPSATYQQGEGFKNEAAVVHQLLDHLRQQGVVTDTVHLVGHSMGSEVITDVAVTYPDDVRSLVLLNPAGVNEREQAFSLATRFLGSGAYTAGEFKGRLALSGEVDYERALYEHIPKTQSPFTLKRLGQRRSEAAKLSQGRLLEKLRTIDAPVTFIAGELDSVYPPGAPDEKTSQLERVVEAVCDHGLISTSVMQGLRHNTTLAPDEITAVNINHYLDQAERASRGEMFNES